MVTYHVYQWRRIGPGRKGEGRGEQESGEQILELIGQLC